MCNANRQNRALILGTLAMIITFMSWSSFGVLINNINLVVSMSQSQQKVLVAFPVLLGSLFRIPIGYLSDRYGGKRIYIILFLLTLLPLFTLFFIFFYFHPTYLMLLILSTFIGISGASFSVSTSYASSYFSEKEQGKILGIVGVGTVGNAIGTVFLPAVAQFFHSVAAAFLFLIVITLVFLILFIALADETNLHQIKSKRKSGINQKLILFILSLSCVLSSGAFVTFGNLIPVLVGSSSIFHLSAILSGVLSAVFSIFTVISRPLGGELSDKYNPKFLLMSGLISLCLCDILLAITSTNLIVFILFLLIYGLLIGLGNGFVFRLVALYFPNEIGITSGIVAAMGSLGGFVFPIIFSMLKTSAQGFIFMAIFSILTIVFTYVFFIQEKQTN